MRTLVYSPWFLFLCCLFPPTSFCQNKSNPTIGKVTISSPNAAALGKYGDIPVNTHTGLPNINIPIYTVKSGSLQLPISLSYHAGLKVQEQASWVGSGWSLNAGGVITRTVMGAPDDRGLNAFTIRGHYSDYGYNSYIFGEGPATCSASPAVCPAGRSGMPPSTYPPQDSYIESGIFDGEPDFYFFNFNGHSGKFYFNDDRTPMIEPEQDLKIVPIYPGNDWKGMTGFIITTSDGTQYYFGKNQNNDANIDATEITYNITSRSNYNGQGATSSWFLNKIVSTDGQFVISLYYQAEKYSYYTLSMYPIPQMPNPNIGAYNYEYDINKNYIEGVRLSSISFDNGNGTINFVPGSLRQDLSQGGPTYQLPDYENSDATNGAKTLGSISIQANTFCKSFNFSYNYVTDPNGLSGWLATDINTKDIHSDKNTLMLASVQEGSCDMATLLPAYTFTYNGGIIARKLSFGIDHWGFYNKASNTGLIPSYTIQPAPGSGESVKYVSGADRDAHWPASLGGTLLQINYPTGGSTLFTYEKNTVAGTQTVQSGINAAYFSSGYTNSSTYPNNQASSDFTADPRVTSYSVYLNSDQQGTESNCASLLIESNDQGNHYFSHTYFVDAGKSKSEEIALFPGVKYTCTFKTYCQMSTGHGASANVTGSIFTTLPDNIEVGGPRIATITDHDGITTKDKVTSFRYTYDNVVNGVSSGKLYSIPVYIQGLRNDAWGAVNGMSCSSEGCFTCFNSDVSFYQSPSSLRPMSTSQGSHIGYGEVYVSQTNNGYSQYKYYGVNGSFAHIYDPVYQDVCVRTASTLCNKDIPSSPTVPEPFDPKRGELAYEAHYNEAATMLKSISYNPVYVTDPIVTPGIISKFYPTIPGTETGITTFTEYALKISKRVQDNKVTNIYDPVTGKYVTETETINYGSDYHHAPTQIITETSKKNEQLITNVTSSFDYRLSNFSAPDGLNSYNTNISSDEDYLATQLATVVSPSTNSYYQWDRLNIYVNYRYMKALDRQSYIAFRKKYYTDPASPDSYVSKHTVAEGAADASLKPVFQIQDNYINAPLEVTHKRNDALLDASWTNYGPGLDANGYNYPSSIQAIHLSSSSVSFTQAAVNGNNTSLVKDQRYDILPEMTLQYKKGNIVNTTPRSGTTTNYIWDYNNTEPIAKIANASGSGVAYTSFEAEGTGNWAFTPTAVGTGGITGDKSYTLNSSNPITKTGLPTGNYVISYWLKAGSGSVTINGYGNILITTHNGWSFYQRMFTNITGVTITCPGSNTATIDEVRLYPADAQMTTYTYAPLIGLTSQCDENNRITYYEYDGLSRLARIRDMENNILRQYSYKYQGAAASVDVPFCATASKTHNNSTNAAYSATLTNTITGAVTTFSIPANSVSSLTAPNIPSGIYNMTITPVSSPGATVFFRVTDGKGNQVVQQAGSFAASNLSAECPGTLSIAISTN